MGGVAAIIKSTPSIFKAVNKPAPVAKPMPAPVAKPIATTIAPTTAEVSQSTATDADGYSSSVKTKRKGRSATILTSSAGVEGDVTLGKKSLLGS
tara:strand:+ start:557 stop:841 length:285 start_codon:yes stop_codon:yes gene_type:complete